MARQTVAIVGAGMAGLAAASVLRAAGATVLLFEANDKVGGCCATTNVEGYTFNDGAVYVALPRVLDALFTALGLDRERLLPLRKIDAVQSTTLPDGTLFEIASGPRFAVRSPAGPANTQRLHAEVADFLARWEPALRFLTEDFMLRPLSPGYLLARGWRHLGKLRGTVASHLEREFSSEAARAAFAGALLYAGVPPDRMPGAAVLGLVSMLKDGYFIPEGGMGRIPEVLSAAVRAQGAEIRLNAPVRRIVVRKGRACAVELAGAGAIDVDAVLSTVSAMHTYGSLLSAHDVPGRTLRKVRRAPLSHKGFVVQLGLANRVEARSHINGELPWLGEQSRVFTTGPGDMRWSTYMVPTVTAPALAPGGCSIIEMYPSIGQERAAESWTEAQKQDVTARAVEMLRRRHRIEVAVCRASSPKDFQERAHLYAGALYGLSPIAGPGALYDHRTPIRGLYQAGQTTWPGFGVACAGLSGVFAARALIRDRSVGAP